MAAKNFLPVSELLTTFRLNISRMFCTIEASNTYKYTLATHGNELLPRLVGEEVGIE